MLPEERIAAGRVAGTGFAEAVAGVQDTHRAVARRVFDRLGSAARPAELSHDAIAELAYEATRTAGRGLLALAGRGAALAAGPDAPALDDHVAGRLVRGALSGAFGDALAAEGNPLAVEMAVRVRGHDVPLEPATLAAGFPGATGRIVVFVHGLCETEDAWRLGAAQRPPYGDRLRAESGYTPVYVRYNTGLHISENGRRLAGLLDALLAAWPVAVDEFALVGHSMGGLVARSACHYGDGSAWTARVAHVFTLGTPHTGAPLERGAHAVQWALGRIPETRAAARWLGARSAGIKDLGHGYLSDECWSGQHPEAFLRHTAREIPFLETANHYFVAASLARDHDHPFGRYVGDLLVLHSSAWGQRGRREQMRFPVDRYRHIGGASHLDLLNHPAVGEQLVRWIAGRPELTARVAG